jgi:hypothetical protein
MRIAMLVVAVTALACVHQAQAAPKKAPPKQPAAPEAAPAPQPGFFPCRTEGEVCFVGIVTGKNTVTVQFSNAPNSEGIDEKAQNVFSDDAGSTALDMSQNLGRVVMMTGTYDAAKGISKAEVTDVASPLLSFIVKTQLGGGDDQGGPQGGGGGKGAPKRR